MSGFILTGGAAVTRREYATLGGGFVSPAADAAPDFKRELSALFTRFGRFDAYTRIGCLAVFLALKDARLEPEGRHGDVGLILSGQYGSFATDLAYYETASGGGALSSPNLFSYTLPNIVIGECAYRFGLRGPAFCLDAEEARGSEALAQSARILEGNVAAAMLVGWLDILPDGAPRGEEGAQVLVVEKPGGSAAGRSLELFPAGPAPGLDDILAPRELRWAPHGLLEEGGR
jgi:3-oxoacyl-(acyl-carrier-protein) synthase